MQAHLWTGAPAPAVYTELVLCRDVYHCTPLELRQQPMDTVLAHMECLNAEAKVNKVRNNKK